MTFDSETEAVLNYQVPGLREQPDRLMDGLSSIQMLLWREVKKKHFKEQLNRSNHKRLIFRADWDE